MVSHKNCFQISSHKQDLLLLQSQKKIANKQTSLLSESVKLTQTFCFRPILPIWVIEAVDNRTSPSSFSFLFTGIWMFYSDFCSLSIFNHSLGQITAFNPRSLHSNFPQKSSSWIKERHLKIRIYIFILEITYSLFKVRRQQEI